MKQAKKMSTMLTALVVLGLMQTAQGDVLVDFGTVTGRHSLNGSGAPIADSNGNYWDYITGNADNNTNMLSTAGTASGINLQVANFTGPGTYNGGLTPDAGLNGGLFAFTAVTDDALFFVDTLAPTMTLSGLDAGSTYNLVFYGSRVATSARTTTYTVGASSVALQTSGTNVGGVGVNWNDDTVVRIDGITGVNSAVVNLSATGGYGYINAMEIEVIPEPTTLGLLSLSGIGVLVFRRKLKI